MPTQQVEINTSISALRRAIELERRARFADFQGKRSTFSQFMRQAADRLCKRYPLDTNWTTMRGLFRQYPNSDVATRISIVNRVAELIEQLSKKSSIVPPKKSSDTQSNHNVQQVQNAPQTATVKSTSINKAAEVSHVQSNIAVIEVKFVRGVGPKLAELLSSLNIFTVEDLLRHYPRRHLDFQNQMRICDLKPGQQVTVLGTVRSVGAFQSRKGNVSIVSLVIHDSTGSITITRFIGGKSNKFLLDRYKGQYPKGAQVLASGIVEQDKYKHRLHLKNAELELLGNLFVADQENIDTIHTGRLVPVYPLTEGLSLRYLRNIMHNALVSYKEKIEDKLPQTIQEQFGLMNLSDALQNIHFPEEPESLELARKRLVFDELFGIQLQLAWQRRQRNNNETALALNMMPHGLVEQFKQNLPFKLTNAQKRVFQEIVHDLQALTPMHRLVQGDVGSGKTVVAVMAFLIAIENGFQAAMMAPTEILAEQHYRQFIQWLTPLGLRCALLLGKQGQKERRQIQQDLLNGQIHVAVGTHALIQEGVEFKNLGLIIIDEQHRFGVKQRAALKAKGQNPELLTMTATPIPRTLALTYHGDLDVSEIDEMPPGRKPIETRLITPGKKKQLWEFIKQQIEHGHQAYIVFPLIDESETLAAKAATAEYEKLKAGVFSQFRLGLMHGKLKAQEKEEVMEQFRQHKLDILVATTVVEVGVDVPNATVMVVEDADRFGLAQLHQLRGRVGRGAHQSYCFLVSDLKSQARQRLEILVKTNNGFVVAERDLALRGPGEFLGTRQSGLPDLLLSDLVADAAILEQARNAAINLINADPDLNSYPYLRDKVELQLKSLEADLIGSG